MFNSVLPRSIALLIGTTLALLPAGCSEQASSAAPIERTANTAQVDLTECFKINASGKITDELATGCETLGGRLDGFHEGARLMEAAGYVPNEAGPMAAEIRSVVETLSAPRDDRSAEENDMRAMRAVSLELVAERFDQIESKFSLRAEGVTSNTEIDAGYMEFMTREVWEIYFSVTDQRISERLAPHPL